MSATVEKLSSNQVKLTVTVSAQDFEQAMNAAYGKLKGRLTVPGFRKGKAPRKIIENYYGAGVLVEEAFNTVLPDSYDKAVEETGIKPVAQPEIDLETIGAGEDCVYTATVYVRPDVFIVELDGELRAVLNEYYLPQISVSDYYVRLLRESDEPETRDYLRQKLQQAKWLLNSLERRGGTLRRCANAILEAQRPFFTGQTTALAPMSLSTLADTLGLHPSTISRAVRGKYLQCRQGTYPLRYFFSRAVTEQGPSRQAVQQKLLALLASEDPCHPLSDQRLCRLLAEDGMEVARRTVAKYRMELGVGSSAARKHRI